MAYSELIKNFSRIRDYMREFYVYGFKSRDGYTKKSARSYDDERRRLESWLGEYMQFRHTPEGKHVFLSIDSRISRHNPLYQGWKTKSFTDGDITLHFILFDILYDPEVSLTLSEIMDQVDRYLSSFARPRIFDESTVRKKLKEYIHEGVVKAEKRKKTVYYSRKESDILPDADILDFFSEVSPCGVVGSFLLDQIEPHEEHFAFKHHYITGALDSEILCTIFLAIREKRSVVLESVKRNRDKVTKHCAVPLKIMSSVQSGRQYLMAYVPGSRRIRSFRLDNLVSVKADVVSDQFENLQGILEGMRPHMWGVSTQSRRENRMEHVEFIIRYSEEEPFIPHRLEREKRCGRVEHFENHTSRFTADVYDASEMIPWIRTFIGRIVEIHFSDPRLEEQFREDLQEMYGLYGLKGGAENDLQ